MSGYTYFDEERTHQCAEEYIDLIKKTLKKGGKVRYDSGDFLALDQHDRKRVTQSLLEYEHGFKILDTLKVRIQKSLMSQADKDELLSMITTPVAEQAPQEPQAVPSSVVEEKAEECLSCYGEKMRYPMYSRPAHTCGRAEEKPVVEQSFLGRIFNIIKGK